MAKQRKIIQFQKGIHDTYDNGADQYLSDLHNMEIKEGRISKRDGSSLLSNAGNINVERTLKTDELVPVTIAEEELLIGVMENGSVFVLSYRFPETMFILKSPWETMIPSIVNPFENSTRVHVIDVSNYIFLIGSDQRAIRIEKNGAFEFFYTQVYDESSADFNHTTNSYYENGGASFSFAFADVLDATNRFPTDLYLVNTPDVTANKIFGNIRSARINDCSVIGDTSESVPSFDRLDRKYVCTRPAFAKVKTNEIVEMLEGREGDRVYTKMTGLSNEVINSGEYDSSYSYYSEPETTVTTFNENSILGGYIYYADGTYMLVRDETLSPSLTSIERGFHILTYREALPQKQEKDKIVWSYVEKKALVLVDDPTPESSVTAFQRVSAWPGEESELERSAGTFGSVYQQKEEGLFAAISLDFDPIGDDIDLLAPNNQGLLFDSDGEDVIVGFKEGGGIVPNLFLEIVSLEKASIKTKTPEGYYSEFIETGFPNTWNVASKSIELSFSDFELRNFGYLTYVGTELYEDADYSYLVEDRSDTYFAHLDDYGLVVVQSSDEGKFLATKTQKAFVKTSGDIVYSSLDSLTLLIKHVPIMSTRFMSVLKSIYNQEGRRFQITGNIDEVAYNASSGVLFMSSGGRLYAADQTLLATSSIDCGDSIEFIKPMLDGVIVFTDRSVFRVNSSLQRQYVSDGVPAYAVEFFAGNVAAVSRDGRAMLYSPVYSENGAYVEVRDISSGTIDGVEFDSSSKVAFCQDTIWFSRGEEVWGFRGGWTKKYVFSGDIDAMLSYRDKLVLNVDDEIDRSLAATVEEIDEFTPPITIRTIDLESVGDFYVGDDVELSWTSVNVDSVDVFINSVLYSSDEPASGSLTIDTSSFSDGDYEFTVVSLGASDTETATCTEPSITLDAISDFTEGDIVTLTWSSAGLDTIDLEWDDGVDTTTIATGIDATLGTYDWDTTGGPSGGDTISVTISGSRSGIEYSDTVSATVSGRAWVNGIGGGSPSVSTAEVQNKDTGVLYFYVSSGTRGLYEYDGETLNFYSNGSFSADLNSQMSIDVNDDVWVCCNNSLFKFDVVTKTFSEVFTRSQYKDLDGNILDDVVIHGYAVIGDDIYVSGYRYSYYLFKGKIGDSYLDAIRQNDDNYFNAYAHPIAGLFFQNQDDSGRIYKYNNSTNNFHKVADNPSSGMAFSCDGSFYIVSYEDDNVYKYTYPSFTRSLLYESSDGSTTSVYVDQFDRVFISGEAVNHVYLLNEETLELTAVGPSDSYCRGHNELFTMNNYNICMVSGGEVDGSGFSTAEWKEI